MTLLRALIIAGVLALALLPGTASANEFAGIVANDTYNASGSYPDKAFAAMQSAGIGVIRQTLDWAGAEISPNDYDFTTFDNFVAGAAAHNIRVLPVLFDPPPFRSSKPKKHAKHGTYFPTSNADFAAFAATVAQRYGPDGYFWPSHPTLSRLPFTAYQIWNEPNLAAYSPPKPSASKYVAMLKAVGPAIKAVDPQAQIVTAGLPDSRLSKPNLYKFIKQMYQAGAKGSFDTLGINPYAPTSKSLIAKLRKIRGIMNSFGDTSSAMWVTEMGWSDIGPKSPFRVGAKGQAKLITQSVKGLRSAAASLNLKGFFYFAWRDGKPYAGHSDFWGLHTGLLRKNGSRKPGFAALKKAVAAL